ncbi:Uncharacterised protein [Yersinia frederiksenii]|nr:Uncharacterised protein [Yersinia frederiksenii]
MSSLLAEIRGIRGKLHMKNQINTQATNDIVGPFSAVSSTGRTPTEMHYYKSYHLHPLLEH